MLPYVLSITATCGRHTCLERAVRLFINQDYLGAHEMLIFNNSGVPLLLDLPLLPTYKKVTLVNSCDKKYKNLGEIYMDCLNHVHGGVEIITFQDDDDLFLPNHLSEGVKGFIKAEERNCLAYKPKKSYYRHAGGVEYAENTLEPSMFVRADVIKSLGFHLTTSDQHHKWVSYLSRNNKLFIDEDGEPTLIYNWGDSDIPTWKTSGDPANPENFNNYRKFSKDHGDRVVTPIPSTMVVQYYDAVEKLKTKEDA